MNFVKLNDTANTRVNLDNVVAYDVVLTSGSESFNFELDINNSTTILSLDLAYSVNPDEQIKSDLVFVDHVAGVKTPPVSADQDA